MTDASSKLHPLQQLPLGSLRAALRMVVERTDRYLWASRYGMTPVQAAAALGTSGAKVMACQAACLDLLNELFPATAATLKTGRTSGAAIAANADGTLAVAVAAPAAAPPTPAAPVAEVKEG